MSTITFSGLILIETNLHHRNILNEGVKIGLRRDFRDPLLTILSIEKEIGQQFTNG